jgi:hypothetical protein
MWWVLGDVVRAGDNAGRGTGWVAFGVLALYGIAAAWIVVAWARWMLRQRRGVLRWGESGPGSSAPGPVARRSPPAAREGDRVRATG